MKIQLPVIFKNVSEVTALIKPLRDAGKTLVTTNGCFDIVHSGHVKYLSDAAALGDILVVGINSDDSVKRLKGPTRPIQSETERTLLISSLKMVDYAFIFYEDDPRTFLEVLKPDIHVKGGDYIPEKLPEKEVVEKYGGKIVIVPFISGFSTTSIVNKILSS
ncbi:MAG: D-glycero-beta-D-manno-heptose 1-phosphate adenylyltransferase [Fibrobacter sp.]|nr:D-glycero-beta-D-manno-heptose 1-phosphate adenylyltransferase [Fibrobacter sp.]